MKVEYPYQVDLICITKLDGNTGIASFLNCFVNSTVSSNINVEVICIPSIVRKTNQRKKINFTKLMKVIFNNCRLNLLTLYFSYFRHAIKLINDYHYGSRGKAADLLHFQDPFSCFVYLVKNKDCKKPKILTLHTNGDFWQMVFEYHPGMNQGLSGFLLERIKQEILNRIDRIGFVALNSKNNFDNKNLKFSFKSFYCYNGVDQNLFISKNKDEDEDKDKDKVKLICVGTINERKNQGLILQALTNVSSSVRKVIEISFVGDGPMYNKLIKESTKLGLNSIVKFLGSRNDIISLLREHDGFILPSKDEGLPIAIIEAMGCGLPIFSTPVGGIPELIVGNGAIVDCDLGSWIKFFEDISSGKYDLAKMGRVSLTKFSDDFTLDKMFAAYNELWTDTFEKNISCSQ
jgi:glycosyltransferase involved in cell wall biosynthesis